MLSVFRSFNFYESSKKEWNCYTRLVVLYLVLAYLLLSCAVLISVVLANVAVICLVQISTATKESNETGGAGKCVARISHCLYVRIKEVCWNSDV